MRRKADALVQKVLGGAEAPAVGGGSTLQMSLFLNTTAQLSRLRSP